GYDDVAAIVQFYDELRSRASEINGIKVKRSSPFCRSLQKAFRLFISPGQIARRRGRKTHHRLITASSRRNTFGRSVSHCSTDEILPNLTTPSIRPSRLSARLWRKIIFRIGRLSGSGYWLMIPTAILARSRSLEWSVR